MKTLKDRAKHWDKVEGIPIRWITDDVRECVEQLKKELCGVHELDDCETMVCECIEKWLGF